MSINDLLNDEEFLECILVTLSLAILIACAIGIPFGTKLAKNANKAIYGDGEIYAERRETSVKVLSKRTSPHPNAPSIMVYWVTFELTNGSRLELALKDSSKYGLIVEGDMGTLRYAGKQFIDFERSI